MGTQLDRTGRRCRATSTVGASLLLVMVSLSVAMGFLVVPGTERFGVSTAQFLVYYSIFMLSGAVAVAPMGRLVAKYGPRIVVVLGSALTALSYLGMALSPSMIVFYLMSAPLGVGWAASTLLPANTILTGWHTHSRRGLVLGIAASSTGLGGLVWGLVLPRVFGTMGFSGGLLVFAGLSVLLGVLPGILLIHNPPVNAGTANAGGLSRAQARAERRAALRGFGPAVALLTVTAVLFSIESIYGQIQPAVYRSFGIDAVTGGMLLSYFAVCGLLTKPVLGFLHDRLGTKALLGALGALFILGVPAISLLGHLGLWAFLMLIPIAAISLGVPTVILPLLTAKAVGQTRFPAAYGTVVSGMWVGLALGAPLWGLIFDLTGGYGAAMYVAGAVGLVGLYLAHQALRSGDRARATVDAAGSPVEGERAPA
ncbi:MFS transporter [Pseudonocardia halophobica]|uniref:MFS transporter n=1 Tax=Pseudonocardia halophobica TaxID=29401 RepID=UPI0018CC0A2D|nr:MFS transporter [Pseudonocardia halophobica]